MKSRIWAACLACGAVGFVLCSLSQPQLTGQEKAKIPAVVKWEYSVVIGAGEPKFNELGEEGWELFAFDRGQAFFKRQKR
jgi:hypothetical protein